MRSTLKQEEEKLRENPSIQRSLSKISKRIGLKGNAKITIKLEVIDSDAPNGVIDKKVVGNYTYKRQLRGKGRVSYWYIGRSENGKYIYTYLGKNEPTFIPKNDIAEADKRKRGRAMQKS